MMAALPMNLLLLPGDGIGPEIMAVTREALAHVDRRFALGLKVSTHEVGLAALAKSGSTLPDATAWGSMS